MKALIHQEETLFQVSLKNIKTSHLVKLIKTKNKSKTVRFRETNTDEIKKFIEKLDPKNLI